MGNRKVAIVAIGSNSLIKDKNNVSVPSQYEADQETCFHIAHLVKEGWNRCHHFITDRQRG